MNGLIISRVEELNTITDSLKDRKGQVIIVVGHQGMGKSYLLRQLNALCTKHKWWNSITYRITPSYSAKETMEFIIHDAIKASGIHLGLFDFTQERVKLFKAIFKLCAPKGPELVELGEVLREPQRKAIQEVLLDLFRFISDKMHNRARAVFIIDPEPEIASGTQHDWWLLIDQLPPKVKIVFAQRLEDSLVQSLKSKISNNVITVPVGPFNEAQIEELVDRVDYMGISKQVLLRALEKYQGHPYAIQEALRLLRKGEPIDNLPCDPFRTAPAQWKRICKIDSKAIRLFNAYSILQVPVSDEIISKVSKLDRNEITHLLADDYIDCMLDRTKDRRSIYNSLLTNYIREKISQEEAAIYQRRAIEEYRSRLTESPLDPTIPLQLAEHVLDVEGPKGFIQAVVNECIIPLQRLGMLEMANSLIQRGMKLIECFPDDNERIHL